LRQYFSANFEFNWQKADESNCQTKANKASDKSKYMGKETHKVNFIFKLLMPIPQNIFVYFEEYQ
jgi:hypothetical protein